MKRRLPARLLAALIPLLAAALHAGPAETYKALLSDDALYAGEGVVNLDDYGDDLGKARNAARERARASLAEGIKVRVRSRVTDVQRSGEGGSSESTEAVSRSSADLELENISYRNLEGFPKAGQLTVVATLEKLDYERQVAGKRRTLRRPQWGLGVVYSFNTFFEMDQYFRDEDAKSRSGIAFKPGSGVGGGRSNTDTLHSFGLQFRWREASLLLENGVLNNVALYPFDPATGLYGAEDRNIEILGGEAGYDVTPWAWRLQPYLPLRLRVHNLKVADYSAWTTAASAGLGLRYWPTDSVYLDFSGRWLQALNKAVLSRDGSPLYSAKDKPAELGLGGAQWQLNLSWTGF